MTVPEPFAADRLVRSLPRMPPTRCLSSCLATGSSAPTGRWPGSVAGSRWSGYCWSWRDGF